MIGKSELLLMCYLKIANHTDAFMNHQTFYVAGESLIGHRAAWNDLEYKVSCIVNTCILPERTGLRCQLSRYDSSE